MTVIILITVIFLYLFPNISEEAKSNYDITYDTWEVKIISKKAPEVTLSPKEPTPKEPPKVISVTEDADGTNHAVVGDRVEVKQEDKVLSREEIEEWIHDRYVITPAKSDSNLTYSEVKIERWKRDRRDRLKQSRNIHSKGNSDR